MATITPKEFAAKVDSDARTVRKFLRSDASPIDRVGKGNRYAIESKSVRSLTAKFKAWDAARTPAPADDAVEDADNEE